MRKSRKGNNSTDIFCCLVGCPAPGEFRGEKLCARGCVSVSGQWEPFALLRVYYCYRRRKCVTTCEADLMRHAACGDQEAFRQLWEAHHDIAQAAALRLCHQCADGRDHPGSVSAGLARASALPARPPVSPLADAHPLPPGAQCDGKTRDRSAAAFPGGAQSDTPAQTMGRTIPR